MHSLDELIKLVTSSNFALNAKPIGYSETEVDRYARSMNLKLPKLYVSYLISLGKFNPGLSDPLSTSIDRLTEVQEAIVHYKLHGINVLSQLVNKPVFFQLQDGLEMYFFYLDDSEALTVYGFFDNFEPRKVGFDFIDFLHQQVTEQIESYIRLQQLRSTKRNL